MRGTVNKWIFIVLLFLTSTSFLNPKKFHPFFISVTEIQHNKKGKALEISCKIFTDDFEKALRQSYQMPVDLINAPDKNAVNKLINDYIKKHLLITANGKVLQLQFIGYEKDNEAIWSYLQVNDVNEIKKIDITNNLLLDYKKEQVNIVHVIVNGIRKSKKLDYSETKTSINF
jgi:hypothetical protein